MATNFSVPTVTGGSDRNNKLFASVDIGTNSFKLLIARTDPSSGRFFTVDRLKEPVVLGRDTIPSSTPSSSACSLSTASQLRAIEALRKFQQILGSHRIPLTRARLVATSAVREAANQLEFVRTIHQTLGLEIDVLSGFEEARLTYVGVLQFHPVGSKRVLTVDIGGGSTEFVIGKQGQVLSGTSLKLGHVTLTQQFIASNKIAQMREHIRSLIHLSGLVEKVAEHGFDMVIGSSGTIRAIEKAIFWGYSRDLVESVGLLDGCWRDWKFSRQELGVLVERLCEEDEEEGRTVEKVKREGFFKSRSEFIVAGAVLLEEILEMLGIDEMEVSGYALAEGVIAEKLAEDVGGFDFNANARWRSVVRLATRFNNKKRMKSAATCAHIAKEIFEGLRKWDEYALTLDEKDLEYVEAACLLHNVGLFTGKKGYHKQSYHIIMNGDNLHGYDSDEIKLIALLAKHHRKKFPKLDHASLKGFPQELKQKFRALCVIVRLSAALHHNWPEDIQDLDISHSAEGFELVLKEKRDQAPAYNFEPLSGRLEAELQKELEHFRMVFQQNISLVALPSTS